MLGMSAGQAAEESIRTTLEKDRQSWAEKSTEAYENNIADCDRQLKNPGHPRKTIFQQPAKDATAPREGCEPDLLRQAKRGKALWRCLGNSATS